MIRISIELPDEADAALRAKSARRGLTPEALVSQAIMERFAQPKNQALSPEVWSKNLRAYVESLPARNANFDDSRDSIYSDDDEAG